jgi:hypothetical protein
VYLPIATDEAPRRSTGVERRAIASSGETVLLAEDEDSVRRLAKRVLEAQGYTVLEAVNGEAALRLAADYAGVIDLLLSDVVMPELGGRLLAERLVAQRPEIEVLFMSGVHPELPSSAVPQPVLDQMMTLARGLLQDNVVDGSSPRIQTYRNLRQLNPMSEHDDSVWVYGRRGKPCRKCGTPIEMKKMGLEARSTYWCPSCQPYRRQSTAGR